jgi:hypothetical protein
MWMTSHTREELRTPRVPVAVSAPLSGLALGTYAGFLAADDGASMTEASIVGAIVCAVGIALTFVWARILLGLGPAAYALSIGALFGAVTGYLYSMSADTPGQAGVRGSIGSVVFAVLIYLFDKRRLRTRGDSGTRQR